MSIDNIPFELQQYPYWCVWKYEQKPDKSKPDKVPYHPLTGQRAKSNDPGTFVPFAIAKQALEGGAGYNGVGVGLFDDLSAADLDDCIDALTGQLNERARDVITTMNTYTEISPSGTGLRSFFLAPGFQYDKARYYTMNKKVGLEMYVAGRTNKFLTVTGNVYGFPLPIADGSATLPLVLEKYMRRNKATGAAAAELPPARSLLTDEQVIEKASKHEKFAKLYAGKWEALGCYPSHSEADQALCNMLAFWCGRDMEQMNRLFISSGLHREKWEEHPTYRPGTLEKAVRDCTVIYDPASAEYRHRQAVKDFAGVVGVMPEETLINPLSDKERYRPSDRGNRWKYSMAGTRRYRAVEAL